MLIHSADDAHAAQAGARRATRAPRHLLPLLVAARAWRLMGHLGARGAAQAAEVEGAETFEDGAVLDVPGSPRVVHTPGHTPGHCVLLFEGHGALFAGDALCTWNPLTGRLGPQLMPSALNVSTRRRSSRSAASRPSTRRSCCPGHGEPYREGPRAAVAAARAPGRS